jgi:hypothetical protein
MRKAHQQPQSATDRQNRALTPFLTWLERAYLVMRLRKKVGTSRSSVLMVRGSNTVFDAEIGELEVGV